MTAEKLSIYFLTPCAGPADPRWDNAPSRGTVVVRARNTGDARIVAAEAEPDFMQTQARPGHGNTTVHASAFRDTLLYDVTLDTGGTYEENGPRGVVFSEEPLDDRDILKVSKD